MKTHLPKGLRAALMAALASVSLTAFVGSSAQAAAIPTVVTTNWTNTYNENIAQDNVEVRSGATCWIFNNSNLDRVSNVWLTNVTVQRGATFGIGNNEGTIANLTMNGGTLSHWNMHSATYGSRFLTIGNLKVEEDSTFRIQYKGNLRVQNLTGDSTLTVSKNSNETFSLYIDKISDYQGAISVNTPYSSYFNMNIGSVEQAKGMTATVSDPDRIYLRQGFSKTGEGKIRLISKYLNLAGNATISAGSVEVSQADSSMTTFNLQGNTISLSNSGSLYHDGFTYTARDGMTGSIKSSAEALVIYNNGANTTLKDVVLTTDGAKAISVTLDNVSLVNTGDMNMWLTGTGITKNLVDVTTGGTLHIGAGTHGNGDTINATISGTANIDSLKIGDKSTLTVKAGGKLHLGEALATGASKLTMESGSTLSVKEGDLFAAAAAPGSSYTLSGVTLEANEGNWTINKAIGVKDATITGSHAVAFGSEVDSNAKVTMSGTINATGGNLILKNSTVAANTTATLSGHITFEGVVDNKGTLAIANDSTINIDEESLIRNGRFIDGTDTSASDKNGFFADTEVCLSTGGAYTLGSGLKLTLDGVEDSKLQLITESETKLLIGGLSLANTYFVREGEVAYSHITEVSGQIKRDVKEIAVGTDGVGNIHQLTLDKTLAERVKVVSASDHANVLLSDDVVLNASQTAIKGEANELHVTFDKAETAQGTGFVLMDDTTKLSQIAGDATMKLRDEATTFSTEAKMEGKLVVDGGQTLNLEDKASIASFSSVELGAESKLVSKQAGNDSIKSLSGSGDLSKTGAGKLTVKDTSGFTGEINASAGTLELEGVDLTGGKAQKVSVSNSATVNLVDMKQGTDGAAIELSIDGGTFGVYINGTAVAGEDEVNVGNLTLAAGNTIVIGSAGGTLEANLTTKAGSTLDFSAGAALTMGCDVNMGKGTNIVINSADFAKLQDGGMVTLFNGVDNSFCMDVTDYVFCELVTASEGSGDPKPTVYFQTVGDKAVLSTTRVPEPATGTLSLLALAGLCARRRRKH